MKQLARSGRTMIVVAHEIGFARGVADDVVFMADGRVAAQGPPSQVSDDPQAGGINPDILAHPQPTTGSASPMRIRPSFHGRLRCGRGALLQRRGLATLTSPKCRATVRFGLHYLSRYASWCPAWPQAPAPVDGLRTQLQEDRE